MTVTFDVNGRERFVFFTEMGEEFVCYECWGHEWTYRLDTFIAVMRAEKRRRER